ncbi:hypothetical protein, partial [Vibrio bivalvicida]|uniref:hypothetical protein n=1 Tax=Vibrio bivalvicida TaxID=1276888 RepID=UPI001EDAFDFC
CLVLWCGFLDVEMLPWVNLICGLGSGLFRKYSLPSVVHHLSLGFRAVQFTLSFKSNNVFQIRHLGEKLNLLRSS